MKPTRGRSSLNHSGTPNPLPGPSRGMRPTRGRGGPSHRTPNTQRPAGFGDAGSSASGSLGFNMPMRPTRGGASRFGITRQPAQSSLSREAGIGREFNIGGNNGFETPMGGGNRSTPSVVVYSRTPSVAASESEREASSKRRKIEPTQNPRPISRPSLHPIFKCDWQHPKPCTSELHDIDTLRRHVEVKHTRRHDDHDSYSCHWNDCSVSWSLNSSEALYEHVQFTHISAIEKEVVAAERAKSRAKQRAADYFSDSSGRLVTPTIRPAAPEGYSFGDVSSESSDEELDDFGDVIPKTAQSKRREKARLKREATQKAAAIKLFSMGVGTQESEALPFILDDPEKNERAAALKRKWDAEDNVIDLEADSDTEMAPTPKVRRLPVPLYQGLGPRYVPRGAEQQGMSDQDREIVASLVRKPAGKVGRPR